MPYGIFVSLINIDDETKSRTRVLVKLFSRKQRRKALKAFRKAREDWLFSRERFVYWNQSLYWEPVTLEWLNTKQPSWKYFKREKVFTEYFDEK